MAKLATKAAVARRSIEVRGLLVDLPKAAIMKLALELGVEPSETVSCYQPDAEGRACGACDACQIRKKGSRKRIWTIPRGISSELGAGFDRIRTLSSIVPTGR